MKPDEELSFDPDAVTPEERDEAERLARALDGEPTEVDETLAAAHLLISLRDVPADDVARRRLRRQLVAQAGHARRRTRAAVAAGLLAAAAAALLFAVLGPHKRPPSSEALLAEREIAARRAIAPLLAAESNIESTRLERTFDELEAARLSEWQTRQITKLLETTGTRSSSQPNPTPGGRT